MSVVCIAFPTIMSGLVLRWYSDETQAVELANAGRESVTFKCFPSDHFRAVVEEAHAVIRDAYARSRHPKIDTSQWVTHRRRYLMSNVLEPAESGVTDGETNQ